MLTGFIRIGRSEFPSAPIDEDSYERILACLRVLDRMDDGAIRDVFTKDCKAAYVRILREQERVAQEAAERASQDAIGVQVDDAIVFRQFQRRDGGDIDEVAERLY